MRFERAVWASLLLVSLATPAAAERYWVDNPDNPMHPEYAAASDYKEPNCPPGYGPELFGVVIIDSLSRPIYECRPGKDPVQEVSWESLDTEAAK